MNASRAYDFTDGAPQLPPVRFSSLKFMAESPAHYRDAMLREREETKALRLGSALDGIIFETREVSVYDGAVRRGKAWEAFAEQNKGAIILTELEFSLVRGMVDSLRNHPDALEMLQGEWQSFLSWDMNGRRCNGTPDVFRRDGVRRDRVVELKTSRTANPSWFPFDARKFAYHAQLDWYRNALARLNLCSPDASCHIVAVESKPPFPVTVFDLTDRALLAGRKLWSLWFENLLVCESSNAWPEYTMTSVPFDVPDDDELKLLIEGEEVDV